VETRASSAAKEVVISYDGPTALIGERINPTGRKSLLAALQEGDLEPLVREAVSQVAAGADILDVNVGASGVDEVSVLPKAVAAIARSVDVPLCIDFNKIEALKEALEVYQGKPIVNSVSGEERSLEEVLPLVKEYGTAVIALTLDDNGIPKGSDERVAIAHKIVERAESLGISREDVIIDGLALTIGSDSGAGLVTLETIDKVHKTLGVNQTLGASNISFGLPDRILLNRIFLAMAISMGVTCPTVDVAKVRSAVLAADLALGRDRFALRYIQDYRRRQAD
jgi:5-methyltetrahydrofolate--homocysteine methyltransferase